MMMPAMMSRNAMMPRTTSGVMLRRALMTIQLMFSVTAASTSSTQNATKKAIAFWRLVTDGILNHP